MEYDRVERHELGQILQSHSQAIREDREGRWRYRTPGRPGRSYEQTLNDVLPNWWDMVGGTKAQWARTCDTFMAKICEAWRLPKWVAKSVAVSRASGQKRPRDDSCDAGPSKRLRLIQLETAAMGDEAPLVCVGASARASREASQPAKRRRTSHCGNFLPFSLPLFPFFAKEGRIFADITPTIEEADCSWQTSCKRMRFIVDNQLLARWCTGQAKMEPDTRNLLADPLELLAGVFLLGWRPFLDSMEPVEWRPREKNQEADRLANLAMDTGNSRIHLSPDPNLLAALSSANILCWSDGGFRPGPGFGASAWIVRSAVPPFAPLMYASNFHAEAVDSVEMEIRALAQAIQTVRLAVQAQSREQLEAMLGPDCTSRNVSRCWCFSP